MSNIKRQIGDGEKMSTVRNPIKRKYTIVKLNEKIFIWGIKNYG